MQNLLRIDYEKILLLTPVFFRGDYPASAYCSVKIDDDLRLYDAEGTEIAVTHIGGHISGELYDTGSDYRDSCLSPGTTLAYTESTTTIDAAIFDQVASASADIVEGRLAEASVLSPYTKLSSLEPGMLSVEISNYPDFKLSFINTLDYAIELQDDAHYVEFFDNDDYFVGWSYMYLHEGMGLDDESELEAADYIIDASGGTFTLNDEISDAAAVRPLTGTKATVYLRWLPAD